MGSITVITILAFIILVVYLGIVPSTDKFRDDKGNVIPESIAELERVELGNLEQQILIRGKDESNPVLLWLHGGPGAVQMPLAHQLDEKLEEEFVVVHWDQRGAGKSNHRGFDEKTMSFEQFKSDAAELTDYLQKRMNREKIYLLGHSWGSFLGLQLVNENPEDYYAYIGVSQLVDNLRQLEIAHDWLLKKIHKQDDSEALEKLEELGEPPYKYDEDIRDFTYLVNDYGGNFDGDMLSLITKIASSPEYNFIDYIRGVKGLNRGGAPMYEDGEFTRVNIMEDISSLDLPVFFLTGKNDYITPLQLVEEYFEILEAPRKDLVIFEDSAHFPFLQETEKFNRKIINIKKETHN